MDKIENYNELLKEEVFAKLSKQVPNFINVYGVKNHNINILNKKWFNTDSVSLNQFGYCLSFYRDVYEETDIIKYIMPDKITHNILDNMFRGKDYSYKGRELLYWNRGRRDWRLLPIQKKMEYIAAVHHSTFYNERLYDKYPENNREDWSLTDIVPEGYRLYTLKGNLEMFLGPIQVNINYTKYNVAECRVKYCYIDYIHARDQIYLLN